MRRPCIEAGCPRFARGGPRGARCPGCQRRWDRVRNREAGRRAYQDPAYRGYPLAGRYCIDCGTRNDLTRDHIVELHEGGTNEIGNIVVRCRSCNSKKSAKRRREAKNFSSTG